MEKETLSKETFIESACREFKLFKPRVRKQFAQLWRDFYNEIMKDFRTLHAQHERGKIAEESFAFHVQVYGEMFEMAEAAEAKVLRGSGREFSRLIRLRKEKGLTQAEAAVKAGMSLAWYALLEQGFEEKISKEFKQKVCDMLDVRYDNLFFNAPSYWEGKTSEEIEKIFEELEHKGRPKE